MMPAHISLKGDDWVVKGFVGEDSVCPRSWDNTGWAYFDDNYFHLLPGEEVRVRVEWHGVAEESRGIEVSAMNAQSLVVGREDPPGGNRS